MRLAVSLAGLLFAGAAIAADKPTELAQLELLAEHPIEGMAAGNLSGLTRCGEEWLAVSDREDDRFYRLRPGDGAWQAEAETFDAPPVPPSALPWGLRMRTWTANLLRGGELDFESISCDEKGNRYLLSEAHTALLQVGPSGIAEWLALPEGLVRQARASGMLLRHNALLEGLVVDPAGERLWLKKKKNKKKKADNERPQQTEYVDGIDPRKGLPDPVADIQQRTQSGDGRSERGNIVR